MGTNLEKFGQQLAAVDGMLVTLLARRAAITSQVGAHKLREGGGIFRPEIEQQRLAQSRDLAAQVGLDPEFAASILHQVIAMSCKMQWAMGEGYNHHLVLPEDEEERLAVLKQNLRSLTEAIAPRWKHSGGDEFPGTAVYNDFEDALVSEQVRQMQRRSDGNPTVALDLGTAAGHSARLIASHFGRVIGYDLSQHMIAEAWSRGNPSNIEFQQHDLEDGLPHEDDSVDFVMMGQGTASDIPTIRELIREISRVLRPGGRFVLSFYNRDALMYTDGYVSLDCDLAAEVNLDLNCLTVHAPSYRDDDDEVHPAKDHLVYARPYMWGEIEGLMVGTTLQFTRQITAPTLASVIPRALMQNEQFSGQIIKLDTVILNSSSLGAGAYHLMAGEQRF